MATAGASVPFLDLSRPSTAATIGVDVLAPVVCGHLSVKRPAEVNRTVEAGIRPISKNTRRSLVDGERHERA